RNAAAENCQSHWSCPSPCASKSPGAGPSWVCSNGRARPMTAVGEKSGDRVREMFGEISGRYDFLNHLLSGGTDYYWRWRAVRACPPQGDTPILDVCTGTGDLAIAYWKKGNGKVPVFGTDFTPQMLQIARE